MLVSLRVLFRGVGLGNLAFQSTQWSLLDELRAEDPARRRIALERLCSIYWPAVRRYLERGGVRPELAEEITQAFFADAVIGRAIFERADRSRGQLRSLVLAALSHYRIDRARREATRGSARGRCSLDITADPDTPANGACRSEADEAFDRDWASLAVREALRRCEAHFVASQKPGHWRAFELRVLLPANRSVLPVPLDAVTGECGFAAPADAAAAVGYVKRRLDLLLREVVAETVSPELAQEEYEHLKARLG